VALDARDRVLTLVAGREETEMAKGMTLLEQDFQQLDAEDSFLLGEAFHHLVCTLLHVLLPHVMLAPCLTPWAQKRRRLLFWKRK